MDNNYNNDDDDKLNNTKKKINNIKNTKFFKNKANNFGGAIFYEFTNQYYDIKTSNNEILNNNAGIMGGGIHSNNWTNTNFIDTYNNKIDNNTVISYFKNDYSSKISYISLDTKLVDNLIETHSGQPFQLQFSLYDDYDNVITDITKYYSSMILKITIKEIQQFDKLNNNINNKKRDDNEYSIYGNICSFINGKIIIIVNK